MKRLLIFLLLISACGSKTDKRITPITKTDFAGPSLADHVIEINPAVIGLRSTLKKDSAVVSSADVINLSNLFMSSASPIIRKNGTKFPELFSRQNLNATVMSASVLPAGNPYGEQAFYYLKDFLIGESGKVLDLAQIKITEAADFIPNDGAAEGASTSHYMQNIIGKLSVFVDHLSGQNENNPVVASVAQKLKLEYIQPLSEFLPKLQWAEPQRIDSYFIELQKEIVTLPGLSEKDRRASAMMIQEGVDYSAMIENIKYNSDALDLLIDMWLNKSVRESSNHELGNYFNKYSSKELLALATENKPILGEGKWTVLKAQPSTSSHTDDELLALATKNMPVLEMNAWNALTKQQTEMINLQILNFNISKDLLEVRKSQATEPTEKVRALIVYWLGLSRRAIFPEKLADVFNKYDDADLKSMRDTSSFGLIAQASKQGIYKIEILKELNKFEGPTRDGIKNFKMSMREKLFNEADNALRLKIMALDSNLKSVLKTEIQKQLESQRANFPVFAFDKFKEYALMYLNKWFFADKTLPLLEGRSLKFEKQRGGAWVTASDLSETSAAVLGESLTSHYLELQNSTSETQSILGFRAVSKLAALAGFKDYNGKPIDALTIPLTDVSQESRLDLLKIDSYDPGQLTFAVPDRVILAGNYKADIGKTNVDPSLTVSVQGQMALLSGYAQMMDYLKPWRTTPFDTSLATLRLGQFPQKEIFSKAVLFKQALGLSLGILKNIPSKMIGRISPSGRLVMAPHTVANAVGAVLVNFSKSGTADRIYTADIAQAILSLTEFYEVTSDLQNSTDPELRGSLDKILCDDISTEQVELCRYSKSKPDSARKQIHTLLTGLILFSINNLKMPDGGFVEGVDVNSLKPVSTDRKLFDQVIMEKALLKVGGVLKADAIKFRAVDNYFFLNGKFWNRDIGFYRESEKDQSGQINVKNVLIALSNLESMVSVITAPSSLSQLKNLKSYLETRLSSSELNVQSPLELLTPQQSVLSPAH